jgi:hypothetical protein
MIEVLFILSLLVAVGTILMVGIRGAIELYAPIKASRNAGAGNAPKQ